MLIKNKSYFASIQYQPMDNTWYIIINPTSGGGKAKKKINKILKLISQYKLIIKTVNTEYPHHEEELVEKAIKLGYCNFVCVGGDGTIHHMINGIMKQKHVDTSQIKLAVIPTGTGNDWVKNYNIPKDPEKAIEIINKSNSIFQDIGKIILLDSKKEIYFNNAAGIGFDAYVVKNINKYTKWGSMAYLVAALFSFKSYINGNYKVSLDGKIFESSIFLISLGICKYSGAGMQLTNYKAHKTGYFDVNLIKSISLIKVIKNIFKLYNGKINEVKEARCLHAKELKISGNTSSYIQADGELIGKGNLSITLIPMAIQFIVK